MFAPLCKSKLGWQLHKPTEPRNHQEQKLPTMHQSLMRASQLQLPHKLINKTFGDWEKPEENKMCKQESWRWNDSTLKKQCIPGGKAGQSSSQKMPPASARGKGLETPWNLGGNLQNPWLYAGKMEEGLYSSHLVCLRKHPQQDL